MKVVELTDHEHARLFKEGDEKGLKYFYLKFHPILALHSNRWVKDRAIAEDIASEALVRTWKHHWKMDTYYGIKAYLYTATERLSQRYVGKELKRKDVHKNVFSLYDNAETPFDHAVRSETIQIIRDALETLPPGSKRVLTMNFIQGKSLAEIATELKANPNTIIALKNQGLKSLRKIVRKPLPVIILMLSKL